MAYLTCALCNAVSLTPIRALVPPWLVKRVVTPVHYCMMPLVSMSTRPEPTVTLFPNLPQVRTTILSGIYFAYNQLCSYGKANHGYVDIN
jgi:hypothetical protein